VASHPKTYVIITAVSPSIYVHDHQINECVYQMHKNFQKSSKTLQILGTGIVTWSNFHTADPQFWSALWMLQLTETSCLVHVRWYALLYERTITIIMLKILSTATKKFTCLGNQLSGICAPLVHVIPLYVLHAKPTLISLFDLSCSDSRKQC
jgi:hypothetical protein